MISEKLKEIRESTGMNKKEFANHLGIKYTTYNGYETGSREPASDFLILISTKFDISIDYLLGLQDHKDITHSYQLKSSEYEHIKKYRLLDSYSQETIDYILDRELRRITQSKVVSPFRRTTRTIPYYQKLASAGNGEYLFDDIPADMIEVPLDDISRQADFVIGVNGDSMEPTFKDGDLVYVEKRQIVEIGDIGIFMDGNDCFIKEAGKEGLISHNKKYRMIPGTENILCVGKVLGKVTK